MSEKKIDQPALQKLFEKACMLDIRSLKPGNVNTNSPSKNLNYLDFLKSIEACSDIITQPNILLEDRIFESIKSTINIVGTNTNLGIILLCAPIIQAYYSQGRTNISENIHKEIISLDHNSTKKIYEGINLSMAGNMGSVESFDLKGNDFQNFYIVMKYASSYDLIAWEYSNKFEIIFNDLTNKFSNFRNKYRSYEDACSALYIYFLSKYPDTLISRKYGLDKAKDIQKIFYDLFMEVESIQDMYQIKEKLIQTDKVLKNDDINPGTAADFVVATVFSNMLIK